MSGLRVAVFGATGAAGDGALRACLAAPEVTEVRAVLRRPTGRTDAKLREVVCRDFADLGPLHADLAGLDACFYCLGISVSHVPDEAAYRTITYDYALAAARALRAASPGHTFHFLSGQSTNPKSRMMWARVKGETELALADLGLARLVCWRPGYIHPGPGREVKGFAAGLGRALYPIIKPFPGMSVDALQLGEAMLAAQLDGTAGTLENREIRALAARWRARAG